MKLSSKRIEKNAKQIKVISFNTVDSTNNVAKELALNGCAEGTVVCALKQTRGKGRLGRTFLSKAGGVYFSLILRPQKDSDASLLITVAAAVAAARAIERLSGKKCEIKWVNDIYLNGKKVCGILTEGNVSNNGEFDFAILGVGVNLFAPKSGFPSNLPLAGSVFGKKNGIIFKNRYKEQLIAEFFNEFFKFYNNLEQKEFMKEYQQKSFLNGKQITYTKDGETYSGIVSGIDDDARLVISANKNEVKLSHGEIQIVGMEQLPI